MVVLALLAGAHALGAQSTATGPAYRIGPKDMLQIRVFEEPTLNVERRVTQGGTIDLPILGEVPVQHLTAEATAALLKERLERDYLQRASVTVQVTEFRSRPISVIGSVQKPGNLTLSGNWTLLETLTEAGGVSAGHGEVAYILRRADSGLTDQIAISLSDLMVRADPTVNLPIFPGDLINVPAAQDLTVVCIGEISTPGAIEFKSTDRATLLAAIARAGGLTERSSKKILIKREADGLEPQEFVVNYKAILAGRRPDFQLQDGDVIVLKESFF